MRINPQRNAPPAIENIRERSGSEHPAADEVLSSREFDEYERRFPKLGSGLRKVVATVVPRSGPRRLARFSARLNCPHCHQSSDYEVTWLVRTKKRQLPPRADERDRARFAKARSYMVRKDDVMACKNVRCRKRFDITSLQSVVTTE